MTRELSNKIANMGIVCSFLVVCIHVGQRYSVVEGSASFWFRNLFAWRFTSFAVPWFFFISGWLLAHHVNECGWYGSEVRKRIKSLLIPYLFWCFMWVLTFNGIRVAMDMLHGREVDSGLKMFNVLQWFGFIMNANPAVPACWFIRMLMILVVISPLLKRSIDFHGKVTIVALGICYAIFNVMGGVSLYFRIGFSLEGLFYFSVGMFFYLKNVSLLSGKVKGLMFLAIGIILIMFSIQLKGWEAALIIMSIPFNLVGIWNFIPKIQWPTCITSQAFPVFLLHQFVLEFFYMLPPSSLTLKNNISKMSFYVSYCVLTFLLTSIGAYVFKRVMPNCASLAFGGRIKVKEVASCV